jgi:hypothetical protein
MKKRNLAHKREVSKRYRDSHPEAREKARIRARAWYYAHTKRVLERASLWAKAHPERVQAHAYKWAVANPEKVKEIGRRWRENNKEKTAAHILLNSAIRNGSIKRKPCIVCGVQKTVAHHRDYTKPLKVIWYCQKHHMREHFKRKDGKSK